MLTVIPTIDVEGVHGDDPFRRMVLGEIPGSSEDWGVYRLARLFMRSGVPATFFVDVYESSLWGEMPLRDVCASLAESGFDVQLHTHPGWRDDPHDFTSLRRLKKTKSYLSQDRDFMAKLSLNEQIAILREGVAMLTAWTGKRPIAHRSGGYSVNEDTISALREVEIPIDSSMHWGHSNSKLTWSRNSVVERSGVIELPVTVMDYTFALPGGGTIYRKGMKTDLDTCTVDELLTYIEQGRRVGVTIMNLFMHSYSLLRFDGDYRNFYPEPADERKLELLFSEIRRMEDVRVMDCSGVYQRYCVAPEEFRGPDWEPQIVANQKIVRLALNKVLNAGHSAMRRIVGVRGSGYV